MFLANLSPLLQCFLVLLTVWPQHVSSLWPMPRSIQTGSSALVLDDGFKIDIRVPNPPSDLQQAVSRTASYLKNDNLGRLVVGRGANDSAALRGAKRLKSLQLNLNPASAKAQSISEEAIRPLGSRSEGYTLTIPSAGATATLSANSTLGLFRGLTTFEQLWFTFEGTTYTLEAPVVISDSPAFVS